MSTKGKLLSAGAYGKVFLAKDVRTREAVVIKEMKRFPGDDGGVSATMLREASLLSHCQHPHIVRMRNLFFSERHELCLVMEHCKMDLSQFLEQRANQMDVDLIRRFAFQMVSGLSYMHSQRLLHRDLKPQNILVTHELNIKIGDLGLGKEHALPIREEQTTQIVTLWYRSPELLLGTQAYAGKVDVWSLGCIIAEMARKQPLFSGQSEWEMLVDILRLLGAPQPPHPITQLEHWNLRFPKFKATQGQLQRAMGALSAHQSGCQLVRNMLDLDARKRLNAKRLLRHPFFDGMRETESSDKVDAFMRFVDGSDDSDAENSRGVH